MSILFLTGSLEPGKDGVGDYTRLLALECARQHQPSLVIALNDPHVVVPVESAETADDFRVPTLRLPASLPWKKRVELARKFRAQQPVDWVSLQFVCFAFHAKGIVVNLAPQLEPIIGDRPLHVMFHEPWVGHEETLPFKHRIMGFIQRYFIQKTFRRLHPRLVTTSNPFYLSMLKGIGLSAKELPLFGNIPVSENSELSPPPEALVRAGLCDQQGSHPNILLGLFFGSIHPEWKPEPFLSHLLSAAQKTGKRVGLISAGRAGRLGEALWEKLRKDYAPAVDFVALDECSPSQIANLMRLADFGLAAAPWHLLGKSGSVAAMLDHGLPVIVTSAGFSFAASGTPEDPLLHRCDANLESKLVAGLPKRAPRSRVGDVTRKFLACLADSATSP